MLYIIKLCKRLNCYNRANPRSTPGPRFWKQAGRLTGKQNISAAMTQNELFEQARKRTNSLLNQAAAHFASTMPRVDIRFDLRGQSAGMVCFSSEKEPVIRYNALLLAENDRRFLDTTVPHEVAHVVSRTLHGPKIRPHGSEWRKVMRFFGVDSKRCHDYDISRARTRQIKRFSYRCACREHRLTSIRHNRVNAGQVYLCRHCGTRLKATGAPN